MTIDMNTKIEGVVLTKVCNLKPDQDSTDSKTITVKMSYDGLTLGDVFTKALKNDVIAWQNGAGGRKNFANLVDKSVVTVKASAPASAPAVDPLDAIVASAKAAGMEVEEYLKQELAKRS